MMEINRGKHRRAHVTRDLLNGNLRRFLFPILCCGLFQCQFIVWERAEQRLCILHEPILQFHPRSPFTLIQHRLFCYSLIQTFFLDFEFLCRFINVAKVSSCQPLNRALNVLAKTERISRKV